MNVRRGFGSDNHSGVHPQIFKALQEINKGHMPSYGTDEISTDAQGVMKQLFGAQAQVQFVFNGTAANVFCLRLACDTFHSVLCADISHLNVDECGAPEILGHCKLIPLPSQNGKITVETAQRALIRKGDQHFSQVRMLSITQPTELGTLYSFEEMKSLITWAKSQGLLVHIDGARFANAVVALKKSFKELTTDLGVDLISFGGTKNGLMFGEAVIILNPDLKRRAPYLRKQLGQLPSKSRFVAVQFLTYLKAGLWKENASNSLLMAQELRRRLEGLSGVEITQPTQSNAVFARIPKTWVKALRDQFFFYVWDENTFECRFMTSWDTEISDVESFASALGLLSSTSQNLEVDL